MASLWKQNQIQAGPCGFNVSIGYRSVLDSGQEAAWRIRKKSFRGRWKIRDSHTQQSVLVDFLHFRCKLHQRSWLITAQLALPKTESSDALSSPPQRGWTKLTVSVWTCMDDITAHVGTRKACCTQLERSIDLSINWPSESGKPTCQHTHFRIKCTINAP